jgi:protein SCO1
MTKTLDNSPSTTLPRRRMSVDAPEHLPGNAWRKMAKRLTGTAMAVGATLFFASTVKAQVVQDSIPELRKIDVIEHLGDTIPLGLTFTNDAGELVKLGDYFHHGKPVVVVLAYYTCPMLCTLVLNGVSDAVRQLDWLPGKEFQILTISIDPSETAQLAAGKKARYLENLGKPGLENGWRFFVGEQSQSKALADAIGFKYYYDSEQKMYAHPAVVTVLTEDGKISRYLYGIEFRPRDLRMALLEASQGKVGTTIDRLILYCYHYDPAAKGYVALAGRIMKLGGALTLVLLAVLLGMMWGRERLRKSRLDGVQPESTHQGDSPA